MSCKKHWLLVLEDRTNYNWSHFLKEKSELKDLNSTQGIDIRCIHHTNTGENEFLNNCASGKGWV